MILTNPVGRNYKIGESNKYFTFMETINEEDKECKVSRYAELGFDVRCERSRSKKKPGWNIFAYKESEYDFKKQENSGWRIKR